ncbi:hypothetical protein EUGRSUZ_F03898 [Eucalyptus grandis]|uniref:Uncharacterized protein n=2 Tax=Eucalyptus grandis TaxID=71139 RepID=A0ACC3KQB0_EUCGR|nr:hypothetical protein EUGRSUZ_F03898 [Eucalyptus grandis]
MDKIGKTVGARKWVTVGMLRITFLKNDSCVDLEGSHLNDTVWIKNQAEHKLMADWAEAFHFLPKSIVQGLNFEIEFNASRSILSRSLGS